VAIQRRYLWIAQRFVDYLGKKCIAVEAAHAPECDDFLRWELRSWCRRHGRIRATFSNGVAATELP
jgi:hypothetical protein